VRGAKGGVMTISNLEKYKNCFIEAFALDEGANVEELTFQGIKEWDSVGHMTFVAMLEDCFGIMLDTDDIIDLSSFEKGREILKKYDVEI
jgi:acyl carrier protein